MRRFLLAAGIACAILLTQHAGAQNPTTAGGTSSSSSKTLSAASVGGYMPGQIVGSTQGQPFPIGKQLPVAAPQVGLPVSANGLQQRPYDPNHPYSALKGSNIDPKQILAPLIGPDGQPVQPPDKLDELSDRIKAFFTRGGPPRPNYTPGIYRRDRQRVQQLWRRD